MVTFYDFSWAFTGVAESKVRPRQQDGRFSKIEYCLFQSFLIDVSLLLLLNLFLRSSLAIHFWSLPLS